MVAGKSPVKIEWKGLKEYLSIVGRAPNSIAKASAEGVTRWCQVAEKVACEKVHVRTGYLQFSIFSRVISVFRGEVGARASYAGYVERGTRRMKAQPYMGPAVEEATRQAEETILKALERRISR